MLNREVSKCYSWTPLNVYLHGWDPIWKMMWYDMLLRIWFRLTGRTHAQHVVKALGLSPSTRKEGREEGEEKNLVLDSSVFYFFLLLTNSVTWGKLFLLINDMGI